MADNKTADPGAGGATFATDEIAGVDWPYTKQAFGPRDTANEVDDAAGKRLPVKIGEGLGAGSVIAGQISLTGAEAALSSVTARRFRLRSLITNTKIIYLGPAGVSAANGYPLWPGDETRLIEVSNLNVIHAIVESGTQILAYLGEV